MKHYVGSVAADASGSRIAMTSPRGGTMVLWDAERGSILEQRNMADVCGIAPAGTDFLASTGAGQVALGTSGAEYSTEEAWDNHIATIAHS